MAKLLLFLLFSAMAVVVPRSATAVGTNYLLSGETLETDGHLKSGDFDLVMQGDCNAVLYNGNWQSNTAGKGRDCKLTLTDRGELVIKNGDGSAVYSSGSESVKGNYALVVHPVGKLVIYGPSVFKINPSVSGLNSLRLRNIPIMNNMLFSGQILYGGGKLTARDHMLVMQGDCNLVLYGGNWQSNTHGNGQYCFLRLTHKGELVIKDDSFRTVWTSRSTSSTRLGDFVFILQDDGFGVIYGPAVWETSSKRSTAASEMMIGMVTEKVEAK